MQARIWREPDAQDLPLPVYATELAAGLDLRAAVPDTLTLRPGERAAVSTGIRVSLPAGFEGQVRPRSGLARDWGLGMVNAPGTIDSDYTGIIHVILINWGQAPVTLRRGDRIAQLIVAPVIRVDWEEADCSELPVTSRGAGGFGSTGR